MYAIIATGGKQYRVAANDVVKFERIAGNVGDKINFDRVLMVGGDGSIKLGKPFLSGTTVEGEITAQGKSDKILVFKKKRRKGFKKIQGHKQCFTAVKISKISA
jgi:large subunit ribosomal protein L21